MKIRAYSVSTVDGYTTKYKSPSLAFRKNNTIYYIPLIAPNSSYNVPGTNDKLVHNGEKAIRVRYNNSTYVVPTTKTEQTHYDIAPGTYTPSAFKSLIEKFISENGGRTCNNSFIATVNNQTISVRAGATLYNINNAGSGNSSLTYGVNFSGSQAEPGNAFGIGTANGNNGFTENKVYVTQSRGIPYFSNYANYNIYVSGIKFI